MINVSNAFKQELFNDRRNYLEYVDIELKDDTVLNLTNKDLWGGGLTIEDAVSKDNSFDVGSAIVNKCTVVINNIYDEFSEYDFGEATVFVYVGLKLPDGTTERIRKGTYTVDETSYNGSIITLQCLDNMRKFDKPYSESKLNYPATLNEIVRDACTACDVSLQTYNFPHDDFAVQTRPNDEAITFREIISWCAQIAGCFCRCDTLGRLEIKWYDQLSLEKAELNGGIFDDLSQTKYMTGDNADGGNFNPWNTGYVVDGGEFGDRNDIHYIYSTYSLDISTDDVVITGVKVVEKNKEENQDSLTTYQSGTDGYVVSIENNELIKGGAGQFIAGWIGEQLIGFRFRKANIAHASDPTIEAGDIGVLIDRKQNTYRIVISSTKFSTGSNQITTSSAQNPARNSAARFSAETKNYVELRKDIEQEKTEREKAQEELKDRIDNSSGLFTTEVTQPDGSTIFYMHDKPTLEESMIVWKMTAEAFAVSTDGGKTYNAGLTVDGDLITRILTAVGINAEWIKAGTMSADRIEGGTLVLGGIGNRLGYIQVMNNMYTDGVLHVLSKYDNSGLYFFRHTYGISEEQDFEVRYGKDGIRTIKDGVVGCEISAHTPYDNSICFRAVNNKIGFYGKDDRHNFLLPELKEVEIDTSTSKKFSYQMECTIPTYFWDILVKGESHFANQAHFYHAVFIHNIVYFEGTARAKANRFVFLDIPVLTGAYDASFDTTGENARLCRKSSSSIRYKIISRNMEIKDISRLYNIQPVIAKYKAGYLEKGDQRENTEFPMFIAENIYEHYPLAVDLDEDGRPENWNDRIMIPAMFQMIKSQKEIIDNQQKEIETLASRIERLEELLLKEGE